MSTLYTYAYTCTLMGLIVMKMMQVVRLLTHAPKTIYIKGRTLMRFEFKYEPRMCFVCKLGVPNISHACVFLHVGHVEHALKCIYTLFHAHFPENTKLKCPLYL